MPRAALPPGGPPADPSPRRPRAPRGARLPSAAPLLAAALVGAGCSNLASHVHNLTELHGEDGSARYVGDLTNALELALRNPGGSVRFRFTEETPSEEPEPEPEPIDDPYGECLDVLLSLAEYDASDPRVAGVQVQFFGWLAGDDAYALSRERCILELARHAGRLEVRAPAAEPESPAGADALQERLMALQEHAFFALRGGVAPGSDPAGLRDACRAVADLPLDRAGGRRALAFANLLVAAAPRGSGGPAERFVLQPLYDLHATLQRRFVAQALLLGLGDPHPFVRAAALEAALGLPESDDGALLERALADDDATVVVRALGAIERRGLPTGAAGRETWLNRLVVFTQMLDGRVSAAACRALGAVSGAGFTSLRAEDWRGWWAEAGPGPTS